MIKGKDAEETKTMVLNGSVLQVFFIPPFIVVHYKVMRTPIVAIPVASLTEKKKKRGRDTERENPPDRPTSYISSISCLPSVLLSFVTITQIYVAFQGFGAHTTLQQIVTNSWSLYPI